MRIGVDLGGTTIKAGLVNKEGRVIFQDHRPTLVKEGFERIVADIAELVIHITNDTGLSISEIESVGIGIPGLTDAKSGKVIYCTNLWWENVPLVDMLTKKITPPVFIENDATVAALAESLFGSTKKLPNSVFLTLGTGVGGGIIIDGKVYSGSHGAGSELGHMIVGENFYDCNCGKNGCLETFTSATAMIKYAVYLIENNYKNINIDETWLNNKDAITAKMIFDMAKNGDVIAEEVVERMIKYLAIGVANIYNVLDPDIIAIGGGVSKAGDYLLQRLREKVKKYEFSCNIKYGEIVLAELGNEAGIIGAAYLGK